VPVEKIPRGYSSSCTPLVLNVDKRQAPIKGLVALVCF
jgi:hypothetical protein